MPSKSPSYYGAFFWLSVAAFIVPLFVAVRAFQAAPEPYSKPVPAPDASGVDHAIWDYLLKAYVENGLVDYDGMKRDYLFKTYLGQLGAARPDALATDAERLALYCNAYNAFVVNGVIIHDIRDSVMNYRRGIRGFFDIKEHILAGETMSLNYLEHQTIRPKFQEPRVHMALVCAAKSCPALRPEAYIGGNLERQLEDQARSFANDPAYVRFNADKNKIELSAILKWYGEDFDAAGGYLSFLASRVSDESLRAALEQAEAGAVKTDFDKYDWSLNAQETSAAPAGAGAAGFGSGSVPNE
ncbi:MAG: DUF547 domain-containing protein [Nitrospiraceae bacterium]|nr:DUF547 domain-containing protein [Nitrospiraceae bacterium]